MSGPVPARVDGAAKGVLLGLIDDAIAAGWTHGRACAVLGLDRRRAWRWQRRRAAGTLDGARPGGRPVHGLLGWERDEIVKLFDEWGDVDRSHRKLAHRGSCLGRVWVSPSTVDRVLAGHGLVLAGVPRAKRAPKTPWPDWCEWRPNQLWCWDGTQFPRCPAAKHAYAIVDVVSRKWIATHLTSTPDSVAARVLFAEALQGEGLLSDEIAARLADPDAELPDSDDIPLLLALPDNGPEMRAGDTARFMAACSIAQHFGRPSAPTETDHYHDQPDTTASTPTLLEKTGELPRRVRSTSLRAKDKGNVYSQSSLPNRQPIKQKRVRIMFSFLKTHTVGVAIIVLALLATACNPDPSEPTVSTSTTAPASADSMPTTEPNMVELSESEIRAEAPAVTPTVTAEANVSVDVIQPSREEVLPSTETDSSSPVEEATPEVGSVEEADPPSTVDSDTDPVVDTPVEEATPEVESVVEADPPSTVDSDTDPVVDTPVEEATPEVEKPQISSTNIPAQARSLSVQLSDLTDNTAYMVLETFFDIYGCLAGGVCSWTMEAHIHASIMENMIDVYGRDYPRDILSPIDDQLGDALSTLYTLVNTFSEIADGYNVSDASTFAELKSQSSGLLNSLSGDIFSQIEDAIDQMEILEVPENALFSVRQAVDKARVKISEVLQQLNS